jgi:hypothetical protein
MEKWIIANINALCMNISFIKLVSVSDGKRKPTGKTREKSTRILAIDV